VGLAWHAVTLADLSADFNRRLIERGQTLEDQNHAV
jgi:hypothetical protein